MFRTVILHTSSRRRARGTLVKARLIQINSECHQNAQNVDGEVEKGNVQRRLHHPPLTASLSSHFFPYPREAEAEACQTSMDSD